MKDQKSNAENSIYKAKNELLILAVFIFVFVSIGCFGESDKNFETSDSVVSLNENTQVVRLDEKSAAKDNPLSKASDSAELADAVKDYSVIGDFKQKNLSPISPKSINLDLSKNGVNEPGVTAAVGVNYEADGKFIEFDIIKFSSEKKADGFLKFYEERERNKNTKYLEQQKDVTFTKEEENGTESFDIQVKGKDRPAKIIFTRRESEETKVFTFIGDHLYSAEVKTDVLTVKCRKNFCFYRYRLLTGENAADFLAAQTEIINAFLKDI